RSAARAHEPLAARRGQHLSCRILLSRCHSLLPNDPVVRPGICGNPWEESRASRRRPCDLALYWLGLSAAGIFLLFGLGIRSGFRRAQDTASPSLTLVRQVWPGVAFSTN